MSYPMVSFKREGARVLAWMDTDLPAKDEKCEACFPFTRTAIGPASAELLLRYLRDRMNKTIVTIRKNAYEQGWKDAKAKRKKATVFSGYFGIRHDGGCW